MMQAVALSVTVDDRLRRVIASQRARIEELERVLGARVELHSDLHLTPHQRQMFGMVLARDAVTDDGLYTVIYGALPECDQPDLQIIKVQMCKLNATLRRYCKARGLPPLAVERQWGSHYFMTAENKARGRALLKVGGADSQ